MRAKPLIAIPLLAIALAGCSAQPPTSKETTSANEQKPLFATDAEALAAAEAAYANYLEVSDQIARDGGANPERLKGLVTPEMYLSEKSTLDSYAKKSIVMSGKTLFDTGHIQSVTENSVSMYLCLDTSEAGLSAPEGPVNGSSINRWPLIVTMSVVSSGKLLLADSQTWPGTNFC